MKKKRNLIKEVLACVLVFIALCVSKNVLVQADDYQTYTDSNGTEYKYKLDENGDVYVRSIVLHNEDIFGKFTVPEKIDNHSIKDIWNIYAYNGKLITEVWIPAGININSYNCGTIKKIYVYGSGKITFYCSWDTFFDDTGYRPFGGGIEYNYITSLQGDENVAFVFEDYAFKHASKLTEIPNRIEYIGKEAFWDTGITSFNLNNPGGTITLKEYAIGSDYSGGYTDIRSFGLSADEVILEKMSLAKTKGITQIYNGTGKLIINGNPFYYNYSASQYGEKAFDGNTSVTYIGARDGVDLCFDEYSARTGLQMYGLKKVDNINKLSGSAFRGCIELSGVSFTDNISEISQSAFRECTSIKDIKLPEQIKILGDAAFYGCTGLKSITMPQQLETIGSAAFEHCSNLENVQFSDNIKTIDTGAFGETNLTGVVLPKNLESIGNAAFKRCYKLTSVVFNGGLKSIGNEAFEECGNITEIELPSSVETIGVNAFRFCTKLKKISMPFINITSSFTAYTSLEEVHFNGGSAESFDMNKMSFASLKEICIHDNIEKFHLENMDVFSSEDYIVYLYRKQAENSNLDDLKQYEYVRDLKEGEVKSGRYVYTLSDDGVEIEEYLYNSNETEIEIPEYIDGYRVVRIGANAFSYCTNLQKVTMPDSISSTGTNVFKGCRKLAELKLSSNIERLYWGTYNTSAMTKIEIPGTVKYVSMMCINGCDNLEEVIVDEGVEIFDGHFNNCDSLKKIYIPRSVKTIYYYPPNSSDVANITHYVYKDSYAHKYMQENGFNYVIVDESSEIQNGWVMVDGVNYWYENGVRQGVKYNADGSIDTSYRGKEIYDPSSDAWYWLDCVQNGAVAKNKDVYQESAAGQWGAGTNENGEKVGKWVRYDENGHMVKGWQTTDAGTYYFDPIYGTMAKGDVVIDGQSYYFNKDTGILERSGQTDDDGNSFLTDGWHKVGGVNYWYENGVRQGVKYNADGSIDTSYRGKEIYDPSSDAWYWLDCVQNGAVAKNKDVYQESAAGQWGAGTNENGEKVGKWVRYDENGHMVKGWQTTDAGTYYFDLVYGTMAKGEAVIDGRAYYFDVNTGVLR